MSWPWNELGLSGPAELSEIRAAYARKLKTAHPEEDPEGFQRLHTAYQEASRRARRLARSAQAKPEDASAERPAPPESAPEGQGAEAGWDYDELLEGREAPKRPSEKPECQEPEWDFERLFAEGEEEAQAARRRKLEELRIKHEARRAKENHRRRQQQEEDSWEAVMAAAHALELLHSSGAPLSQWQRFLDSPVFLSVRANLDFIFALEDFLEQRPDLSQEVRQAVFAVYESYNASKYPVYNRLYQLLNVSGRDKRRAAKERSAWRKAWRSYPPWRKAVIVVCGLILAAFLSIGWAVNLQTAFRDFSARQEAKRWTETAPQWLEEDFGEPFVHAVSGDIFAPAADPELYFRAALYGERSDSWPGYQTNYPHILVKRALEAFARERELDLELGAYSHEIGDAPGAYLFNLPLEGAEEDVAALGALLEDLSRQEWYQVPPIDPRSEAEYRTREPVQYTVYLCHRGLAFYEAASAQGFDTEEALALYAQAGPAFCRWILENSGLADRHLGAGRYVLQDREPLELGDGVFFQVGGVDKDSGEARVRYLLASGGGSLFCIPEERMAEIRAVTDLYRGAPRAVELDKLGLIMVTDQMPET